jgi:hypothetical protein
MMEMVSTGSPKRAKKRAASIATSVSTQEKASLIDKDGRPAAAPMTTLPRGFRDDWTLTRLMKYVALTAFTALVTFFILQKENKSVHWEEYHHLLEPGIKEERCFVSHALLVCLFCQWQWQYSFRPSFSNTILLLPLQNETYR